MTAPHPAFAGPARVVLEGRYCRLEPLNAAHVPALYAATSGEGEADRYRWLFDSPPADEAALAQWLDNAARLEDPLHFAVVDLATGRAAGRQALMRIVLKDGVIEIGAVLWGRGVAKTRLATEALYLFARYAFETLGNRRFEWKCNNHNEPSKRAAQRFGFTFEGVFRQHMIIKGENRDTAWFSMLDSEWPNRKAGFEAWLDPANFEPTGQQKTKLEFH
ncbi:MAG: GNAT family protein [Devosia sp.]|nr:GNAT family protein [Devosia sp.]